MRYAMKSSASMLMLTLRTLGCPKLHTRSSRTSALLEREADRARNAVHRIVNRFNEQLGFDVEHYLIVANDDQLQEPN